MQSYSRRHDTNPHKPIRNSQTCDEAIGHSPQPSGGQYSQDDQSIADDRHHNQDTKQANEAHISKSQSPKRLIIKSVDGHVQANIVIRRIVKEFWSCTVCCRREVIEGVRKVFWTIYAIFSIVNGVFWDV